MILAQIKSGEEYRLSKKQLKKDADVKALVATYSFDQVFDYFDRLIFILDS